MFRRAVVISRFNLRRSVFPSLSRSFNSLHSINWILFRGDKYKHFKAKHASNCVSRSTDVIEGINDCIINNVSHLLWIFLFVQRYQKGNVIYRLGLLSGKSGMFIKWGKIPITIRSSWFTWLNSELPIKVD